LSSLGPKDWSLHSADKVVLGSTDASWNAVIAQLEPDTYYVKFDDDIVFVQVPVTLHKIRWVAGLHAVMLRITSIPCYEQTSINAALLPRVCSC